MHKATAQTRLNVLPESTCVQFRISLVRHFEELGYRPISGYGFAVASKARSELLDPVQHEPKFLYHDMVYGYYDDEIIGYGSSAISRMPRFNIYNLSNREAYVSELLNERALPHRSFGPLWLPDRGVVSFPYRGELHKARVVWDRMPDETMRYLQEAVAGGLVFDQGDQYILTDVGWLFYVDLMYYLMPIESKRRLCERMERQEQSGLISENTDLTAWARSNGELLTL